MVLWPSNKFWLFVDFCVYVIFLFLRVIYSWDPICARMRGSICSRYSVDVKYLVILIYSDATTYFLFGKYQNLCDLCYFSKDKTLLKHTDRFNIILLCTTEVIYFRLVFFLLCYNMIATVAMQANHTFISGFTYTKTIVKILLEIAWGKIETKRIWMNTQKIKTNTLIAGHDQVKMKKKEIKNHWQ